MQLLLLLNSHYVGYKCRGLLGGRLPQKRLPWIILEKRSFRKQHITYLSSCQLCLKNWQEAMVSEATGLTATHRKRDTDEWVPSQTGTLIKYPFDNSRTCLWYTCFHYHLSLISRDPISQAVEKSFWNLDLFLTTESFLLWKLNTCSPICICNSGPWPAWLCFNTEWRDRLWHVQEYQSC